MHVLNTYLKRELNPKDVAQKIKMGKKWNIELN